MNRTLNVIRLQFVNRQTYLWVPLLVLAGTILISIAIFAVIPFDGPKYGGGGQAPLWYFLAVGVQALTLSFPFSQAMSLTRREFFVGSLAAAAITSAMLATVFVLLGFVERLTNGYGINGYVAYLPWIWEAGWWAAWLLYFVVAVLFFVIGFWAATIYKRWGPFALTAVLFALGLALVGALFVIGRLNAWLQVFEWFAAIGSLGLTLWCVPVIALLAVGSYLTLRRATP